MLAVANLRKNKSQTLSILLLILISMMLLTIGFTMFGMGDFFYQRAQELNAPHWVSMVPVEETAERYAFVRDFPIVEEAEKQLGLFVSGQIEIRGMGRSGAFIIVPYGQAQRMNPPRLMDEGLPMAGNAMFVPHFMALDGDVTLGDEITMTLWGEALHFTLAGATEEIMFGAVMQTVWRVYISQARFNELYAQFPDSAQYLISARLEDKDALYTLTTAYWDAFVQSGVLINTLSHMRASRTETAQLPAMLMAVFAFILLVVGVIVIRFRIINGIEESMVNIGVQKAMGYRNRQIILAIIIQFGVITMVGGVLGIIASQAALPLVADLVEPLLGLRWQPAFNIVLTAISWVAALAIVAVFSFITAIRIRKLHPLTALRSGLATHSFKRNPFPLDTTRGPVMLLLALKSLYMNKKQALMVCIIMGTVSFANVGGIAAYYNIIVNDTAFMRTQLGDVPDIWLGVHDPDDLAALSADIAARPGVARLERGDSAGITPNSVTSVLVEGFSFRAVIIDDFALIAEYSLVDGRFPRHNNEITVGATTLQMLGAGIGDWVTVTGHDGETSYSFIVTGSSQSTNHEVMMHPEAFAQVGMDIVFDSITIRLSPGTDPEAFLQSILDGERARIAEAFNIRSMVDEMLSPMRGIFRAIIAAVLVVVATVIVLVIYIVMKTTISRRRRELGIQKAMGFTTFQLMNQIALGLIPIIVLGAVMGSTVGYLRFNAIFVMVLRGSGIVQANLPMPLPWIAGMGVAFILLSYAVVMLVAWRIRKISAYTLAAE